VLFKKQIMEAKNEKETGQANQSEKDLQHNNIHGSNSVKDPDEWTTGSEPMTGAQASYLKTLSDEAGEHFDESLSKADASKRIEALQHITGRGLQSKSE
jgi:uncharacterized damage-inducible protein DinB